MTMKSSTKLSDIKLGGKVNDSRIIVGGEVQTKSPGKELFIIALDYSAQYPAQTEANNISMSTRVDKEIIENPELYGLKIVKEKIIRDCYNKRKIYWLKKINNNSENQNNFEEMFSPAGEKPEEYADKIYRVEEFKCEFKLDIDEIKKNLQVINLYNNMFSNENIEETQSSKNHNKYIEAVNNIKKLYPECIIEKNNNDQFNFPKIYLHNARTRLTTDNIPSTVIKSVYYVQSSKAENGWTNEHLSLNEIMLTDLRFKRNSIKKQMVSAEKSGDEFNAIRYNSKQLAIKVVCNSTYGASGSRFYAYYDPEIGASITWAAREMIHDLTYVLESNMIFVDEKFIQDNKTQYDKLVKYGIVINKSEFNETSEEKYKYSDIIALSLRRLYDDQWNPVGKFIKLELRPAEIIYQDTDSNYYVIRYLQELFKEKHSPHDINKAMHIMKKHNEFFQNFMALSIFRPPIGLGFEAAKIVGRYFNVKKRYYGIEWNPDMTDKLSENAYENIDGELILKEKYNSYWKPGKTTLPLEDGSYLNVNTELLDKNIDFVNFMHHNNLSVTGMPLTRRDSFRFTNYLNLLVYKEDLMVTRYIGNNQWENCLRTSLENIITNVLDLFKLQINKIQILVNNGLNNIDTEYDLPELLFRLKDYSQQVQYKMDKKNEIIEEIIKRYEENGRKPLEIFERVNYVAVNTPEIKKIISEGKSSLGNLSNFAFTIDELYDEYYKKLPIEEYKKLCVSNYISYDIFIELYIISNLCFRYYFKALCATLSNFAIEFIYNDEIEKIKKYVMDNDERKKQIKNITDKAAEELLKRYFPYGRDLRKKLKANNTKEIHAKTSGKQLLIREYLNELYPNYSHIEDIYRFKTALTDERERNIVIINDINKVLNKYAYNKFNIPVLKNKNQALIYQKIVAEDKLDYYIDKRNQLSDRLIKIDFILSNMI